MIVSWRFVHIKNKGGGREREDKSQFLSNLLDPGLVGFPTEFQWQGTLKNNINIVFRGYRTNNAQRVL